MSDLEYLARLAVLTFVVIATFILSVGLPVILVAKLAQAVGL